MDRKKNEHVQNNAELYFYTFVKAFSEHFQCELHIRRKSTYV